MMRRKFINRSHLRRLAALENFQNKRKFKGKNKLYIRREFFFRSPRQEIFLIIAKLSKFLEQFRKFFRNNKNGLDFKEDKFKYRSQLNLRPVILTNSNFIHLTNLRNHWKILVLLDQRKTQLTLVVVYRRLFSAHFVL